MAGAAIAMSVRRRASRPSAIWTAATCNASSPCSIVTGYFARSADAGARLTISRRTSGRFDPVIVTSAMVASIRIGTPAASGSTRVTWSAATCGTFGTFGATKDTKGTKDTKETNQTVLVFFMVQTRMSWLSLWFNCLRDLRRIDGAQGRAVMTDGL